MIEESVIRHAAFWEQDVCLSCGCVVGDTEGDVLLAECPKCGAAEGRCTGQALATLLALIDREGEEE